MALTDLPLAQLSDLTYRGTFTVPSTFGWGGHGTSFDPAGNDGAGSLWTSTIETAEMKLGEVSIPAVGGAATTLTDPVEIPFTTQTQGVGTYINRVGGSLTHNGRLIVSGYEYYDGANTELYSHWRSTDLTVANLQGPYVVGDVGARFVGGWMGHIPEVWQSAFGSKPCFTGLASVAIIEKTSYGPALFAFDPDDIGVIDPVPTVPLLYYTQAHPINDENQSPATVWNKKSLFMGPVIPTGSRSILWPCRMGKGVLCYGKGQTYDDTMLTCEPDPEDPEHGHIIYDPMSDDQGYHAWPYTHAILAYDLLDLAQVAAGTVDPWDPQPYAVWELPDDMCEPTMANGTISSVAYDPDTRTIYIANTGPDGNFGGSPKMHVWTHRAFTPATPATLVGSLLLPVL